MKKILMVLALVFALGCSAFAKDYSNYSNEELEIIATELEEKCANLSEEEILVIYNENIDLMEELDKRASECLSNKRAEKQNKINELKKEISNLIENGNVDLYTLRQKQNELIMLENNI